MNFNLNILLLIIFFLPIIGIAQDLIVLKNGIDTLKCKILEDKISFLRYKNFNSNDTTVYQINQNEFEYYVLQPQENKTASSDSSISEKIKPIVNENITRLDTSQYFKQTTYKPFYQFNIGLGVGIDYGGIGVRFTFFPVKNFAVFAAGGYAFVGFGYNFGISVRAAPKEKICPYLSAMYGYNAFIQITGTTNYDKLYYGPSFSVGFELKSKRLENYFNIELIIPLRPKAYYDDFDALKKNPFIEIKSVPPPVGFSLGYHIVF